MEKIKVKLLGTDGNVFAVVGAVSKALRHAGRRADSLTFQDKAFRCNSYDEVLQLVMETVEVE